MLYIILSIPIKAVGERNVFKITALKRLQFWVHITERSSRGGTSEKSSSHHFILKSSSEARGEALGKNCCPNAELAERFAFRLILWQETHTAPLLVAADSRLYG